jgi:D-alanyl-D-alanine carboxypeptidase (penicillin-binding protein 5/6)
MEKELRVKSSLLSESPGATKLKVTEKYFLFILLFSLFTFYFLLSSSHADDIHSRSVVVMEASTGKILYAKNPDLRCLPASTTKLMTAIVTMESADLKGVVTISRNASLVSPHKAGFKAGDKVSVEKLLYAALIGSANDAAVALAEAVAGSEAKFVELMNKKAIEIGAGDTKFINPNGLPGPGQYITASDLAKIMNYALRYPKLREIIGTRVAEISPEKGKAIFLKNTDRLLWSDEELVGGKTGFTQKARHCFVCAAERERDTVIVAILGSPSRSDLWRESEMLIGKGFDVLGSKEAPAIYLANVDDNDAPVVKKASYSKKSKIKAKRSKARRSKKFIAEKTGKQKEKAVLAKKSKVKAYAKHKGKKKKNYGVAEREEIAGNKG